MRDSVKKIEGILFRDQNFSILRTKKSKRSGYCPISSIRLKILKISLKNASCGREKLITDKNELQN